MKREGLVRGSLETVVVLCIRLTTLATTLILTTRTLGPSSYGAYISAATLAALMGLLSSLGAGYVVMVRATHDADAPAQTWSYGWPLTVVLGTLMSIAYPAVARLVIGNSIAVYDLFFMGVSELIAIPLVALLGSMLQAIHRVPAGQLIQWIPIACRVVASGVCLALPAAHFIHPFIIGQCAGAFLGLALALGITSRMLSLGRKPRRPTRDEWVTGSSYAAMNIVAANPAEVDKVLSPLLLGHHAAGIYAAASRIMNAAVTPVTAVLLTSQPKLFAHAASPSKEGKGLVSVVAWSSLALGSLAAVTLSALSPLIVLVLGDSFSESAELLPWVSLALPFLTVRLAAGTVLVAMGKPIERLVFELSGIAVLVIMLWLGAAYYGQKGMAVALALSEAGMALGGWLRVQAITKRPPSFPTSAT